MTGEELALLRAIDDRLGRIEGGLHAKADRHDVAQLDARVRATETAMERVKTIGSVVGAALTAALGWLGATK